MSRHLAIEIASRSLVLHELSNNLVLRTTNCEFKTRTSVERKEELDAFLKQEQITLSDFDHLSIGVVSASSTLVPATLFGESDPKEIFRFCFGEVAEGMELDFNRFAEHSIVNVYSNFDWIKSYFVIRFPRVIIQHAGTHLIRSSLSSDTFRAKLGIHIFQNYFLLTIVKHDKLEFYSFFDYSSAEDVIYHSTFVLQQKELMSDTGKIIVTPGCGHDAKVLASLPELFSKIQDLSNYSCEIQTDYHAKSQLLCV